MAAGSGGGGSSSSSGSGSSSSSLAESLVLELAALSAAACLASGGKGCDWIEAGAGLGASWQLRLLYPNRQTRNDPREKQHKLLWDPHLKGRERSGKANKQIRVGAQAPGMGWSNRALQAKKAREQGGQYQHHIKHTHIHTHIPFYSKSI